MNFNKKGFLGPIGDDLPSLIPLLFALVIFFSTFTSTFNVYQKGAATFSNNTDVLRLANVLKGDSYLRDFSEFETACNQVTVSGISFKAFIIPLKIGSQNFNFNPKELVNKDETQILVSDGKTETISVLERADSSNELKKFKCSNIPDEENLILQKKDIVSSEDSLFVRFFPIAFEDKLKCGVIENPHGLTGCTKTGFAVRPVLLVVVAWL